MIKNTSSAMLSAMSYSPESMLIGHNWSILQDVFYCISHAGIPVSCGQLKRTDWNLQENGMETSDM